LVCDGLKGLPDSVGAVWPLTIVQTCVIHVLGKTSGTRPGRTGQRSPRIRGRSTPRRPRPPRPRGWRSPPRRGGPATAAIARLWRSCWGELTPLLAYDVEIRKVICSTNAVESLNARYRRAVRARGAPPQRAGRDQVPLPGHPIPRLHRAVGHPGSSGSPP
jgi:hypothetical protein